MKRGKSISYIFFAGLLLFFALILVDILSGVRSYFAECAIFAALLLFFFHYYEKLRLNPTLFVLIIIALALHCLGVFGWYNVSPFPIQWDHITHFFPIFVFAMVFFNFLEQFMPKKFDFKTFCLILLVLFSALGIGSLVENFEYLGYSFFGVGEGGLKFGTGDSVPLHELNTDIEINVGGWFNTMHDLVANLLGALAGTIVMIIKKYVKN